MEFDYYYVVKKDKVLLKDARLLKYELRTEEYKWVPMFKGYQKATLFQSIHEAEFAIKAVGLKASEAFIVPIKVTVTGEDFNFSEN